MTEKSYSPDEDLPVIFYSPEMEDVISELAEERGMPVGQIKRRASVIMRYLNEQEQQAQAEESE